MSMTIDQWRERAGALTLPKQFLVGGRENAAQSGRSFDVISPMDGRAFTSLPDGGAADVDRAVRAARKTFESGAWSRMAPADRKKRLLRLVALIESHRDELALLDTLCMGMPISISTGYCVQWAINCFEWFGEAIDKLYDEVAPTSSSVLATVTREPVGVVGIVLPWNWPTGLLGWKLPPALAMGNSVVLKPDEQTSLSALKIAALALEAGIPEGVLNVVTGRAEVGEAIGRHADIDSVAFTGSTQVGKLFLKYSAESNMKAVWLECGGKSPNIIFADAPDLDAAAHNAAAAVFINTGQVCAAGTRLIVEESVRDRVVAAIAEASKNFLPGNPLDPRTILGPLSKAAQLQRVVSYIDHGQQEGARLVFGGKHVNEEGGGYYVEPTLFDKVDNCMRIAQDEIFGPVLATITFASVQEAIDIANTTQYGLAGAVWTRDFGKAQTVARALRAGSISVNCYGDDVHDVTVPFGGYKQSGFGRDKSLHALSKYAQLKTTWIKL